MFWYTKLSLGGGAKCQRQQARNGLDMKTITSAGQYLSKKSGSNVNFEFEYTAFDSLEEAIDNLGKDKVLKDLQRMVKLDASNTARESAKVANGDSTRKVMSEEEKAQAKAERASTKSVIDTMKAKAKEMGVSLEEYVASL
jgi:hypothetical protein